MYLLLEKSSFVLHAEHGPPAVFRKKQRRAFARRCFFPGQKNPKAFIESPPRVRPKNLTLGGASFAFGFFIILHQVCLKPQELLIRNFRMPELRRPAAASPVPRVFPSALCLQRFLFPSILYQALLHRQIRKRP